MRSHRFEFHPETKSYRRARPMRQLGNYRPPPLNEDEQEEVLAEMRRRAYLNGIEL